MGVRLHLPWPQSGPRLIQLEGLGSTVSSPSVVSNKPRSANAFCTVRGWKLHLVVTRQGKVSTNPRNIESTTKYNGYHIWQVPEWFHWLMVHSLPCNAIHRQQLTSCEAADESNRIVVLTGQILCHITQLHLREWSIRWKQFTTIYALQSAVQHHYLWRHVTHKVKVIIRGDYPSP